MSDINEVVADAALEVAETATSVAEASQRITGLHGRFLVGGIFIGAGIGFMVGFRIAKKKLEADYHEIADNEIEEMREVFEVLRAKKDDELASMRVHLHEMSTAPKPELDGVMEKLGYKSAEGTPPTHLREVPVPVVEKIRNVFDQPQDEIVETTEEAWSYAAEVKSRNPEIPYIIHADEHEAGEKGYEQVSLTFYEDDDVLADADDAILEHSVVGMHNLTRFGHGSNNPDLLFVRNDELETDFEIAKSAGSYAQEVHGFKHADNSRRRRRDWDG